MSLTAQHIRTIARLSRLALSDEEALAMQTQLARFFDTVVAPMQQVETTGIAPLAHPAEALHEVALRLCDDLACEPDRRAANQQSAPAVEQGLYLVPRVIE